MIFEKFTLECRVIIKDFIITRHSKVNFSKIICYIITVVNKFGNKFVKIEAHPHSRLGFRTALSIATIYSWRCIYFVSEYKLRWQSVNGGDGKTKKTKRKDLTNGTH